MILSFFGNRSHWKKVWIKQFITSVKNLNIRRTISIFPNQNLQGWKKEEQDIIEDCCLNRKCPAWHLTDVIFFSFFFFERDFETGIMKNKLEFHSEACFKEVDVPKNNKQIFPFPCKSCLALFKSVFLCKIE